MSNAKQCRQATPIEVNVKSPEWLEGLRDGSTEVWASAPDMRRGLTYAHGWLTGKLQQEPPSMKRH